MQENLVRADFEPLLKLAGGGGQRKQVFPFSPFQVAGLVFEHVVIAAMLAGKTRGILVDAQACAAGGTVEFDEVEHGGRSLQEKMISAGEFYSIQILWTDT